MEKAEQTHVSPASIEVDTEFFKEALRRRHISQRRLAQHLGISPAAVTHLLRGVRRMQATEAAEIATLLGLHVSEVLERAGVKTAREARCHVRFTVDARGEITPRQGGAMVPAPVSCSSAVVAARCEDPGSQRYGWVYYFEPRDAVELTAHNRLCAVQTRDGRTFLAFCAPGFDGVAFTLQRETGATETAELVSASPVEWVKLLIS